MALAGSRCTPSVHDVSVLLAPPLDEFGDQLRRMLKVCVNHHDDIAARIVEAGSERYLFAEISTEIHDSDRRIVGPECAQQPESIIGAAVIHENDLARQRKSLPDQ